MLEVTCSGLASHPGEVARSTRVLETLWDKLQLDASLGSRTDLTYLLPETCQFILQGVVKTPLKVLSARKKESDDSALGANPDLLKQSPIH